MKERIDEEMECVTEMESVEPGEMVYEDSAYGGSSAVDTDTEDGLTPSPSTDTVDPFPYNEDLMQKVTTSVEQVKL